MSRKTVYAGTWYPGTEDSIIKTIDSFLPNKKVTSRKAIGIMVPHAGWLYSGKIAAQVYASVKIPGTIVLIGPNHTGKGYMVSLADSDAWNTPCGPVSLDIALGKKITELSGGTVSLDNSAHAQEHSLEIQLPMLQYFRKDIKIVPLILGTQSLEICCILGEGIASAIRESKQEVMVLASSDMTHYESLAEAREKDTLAINDILALQPDKLLHTVSEYNISMCGVAPTAVMLYAAKALGATQAQLVSYDTSGTVTGDNKEVVGYAGVIVT
ncbi:MAG: AmmeMemoRadiSam system protein B [bacterium]|nr:AmmeMemoRadiSam system protein B [bacterium]MDD5353925.1 AmmeMemoRadiSam system protein B [bacterium]